MSYDPAAARGAIVEVIENFYKVGAVPRIVVDATYAGVVVPEYLKKMYGVALPIELRPEYPMDLVFSEIALEATLSFQGTKSRCVFPWRSIYVINDMVSGAGGVIVGHLPPGAEIVREKTALLAKSGLRVVKGGKA